jgi:hypothetical protein
MGCPIERDTNAYLAGLDAGYRKADQVAVLADDLDFIVRVVSDMGIYDALCGTGKEVGGLTTKQQQSFADIAHDTIVLFLAGKATSRALIAALENCRPAFDQVIMNAAEDELS